MNSKTIQKTFFLLLLLISKIFLYAETDFYLSENLNKAKSGDYLVTMQGKTVTLYHIQKLEIPLIFIEEMSIPYSKFREMKCLFKTWFESGAPNSTSRSMYAINLNSGQMVKSFAFFDGSWVERPVSNNFLSTLLNLHLREIPDSDRKKISGNAKWQPKLVFDGQWIKNAPFFAWRTTWPNDNSELAGRVIDIYTPEESDLYPSYLPYWLEINGIVGSQKIRIIDSGRNLN